VANLVESVRRKHDSGFVRVVSIPEPISLTHTRNYAARLSKFEILVFLDDDAIIENGFLNEIAKFYEDHKEAGAVGANVLSIDTRTLSVPYVALAEVFGLTRPTKNRCDILPTMENTFAYPLVSSIVADWLPGCAFSVRTDNCLQVGFDENLKRYSFKEDVDFSIRLKKHLEKRNLEVYIDSAARVTHLQTQAFRITGASICVMKESYTWYLFFKDLYYPTGSITRRMYVLLRFCWSRMGRTALKLVEAISCREPQILLLSLISSAVVLDNLRKLVGLDVSYVHDWI
jgi:GT2 family glycosyltransferase